MPTTFEELEQWMQVPKETEGLEFKKAKDNYSGEKLMNYCVAIANERGGKFILGVTDDLPRKVTGTNAVSNCQGMQRKILDTLRFDVRVEELQHPDGRVVIFHIPSRPIGMALEYKGKYLMRSGEDLRPMPPERLRAIFDEGKPDWLMQATREHLLPERCSASLGHGGLSSDAGVALSSPKRNTQPF
ncbi:MAG: AlbA family DNA-binding domain-containing protein [Pyrinomonadaceae bacterium]